MRCQIWVRKRIAERRSALDSRSGNLMGRQNVLTSERYPDKYLFLGVVHCKLDFWEYVSQLISHGFFGGCYKILQRV